MIGSSIGLFDWTDRAALYGPVRAIINASLYMENPYRSWYSYSSPITKDDVVLSPELLVHTKGNQEHFQNETRDHRGPRRQALQSALKIRL
jgi:hypothetical protein